MVPREWLDEIAQSQDGCNRLLNEEGGSLAVAAYRIARAKCLSSEISTHVPTRIEVKAAAKFIAARVPGTLVPPTSTLASECEAFGLNII